MVRLADRDEATDARVGVDVEAFFRAEATPIARLCAALAGRFASGGRLIALGSSGAARSDAHHVAVEFMHPVIVGKRALPAIAGGRHAARRDDAIIVFDDGASPAIAAAHALGCESIAFAPSGAAHEFLPPGDAFERQEAVEIFYHVLWELVHVFFEHGEGSASRAHPGQSAFLYPFLTAHHVDRDELIADVARSVVAKARETMALRSSTLDVASRARLERAADECRHRLDAGGSVLALGNGGSATDAMDLVADLREPPDGLSLSPRAALDLTADPSILTALANDVGPDLIFARQIEALGASSDIVVAFSTSGNSRNVLAALERARARGCLTIAFTGYDGGRIAGDEAADCIVNAPSQHIPRIQEAHAAGYHLLRRLIG